MNDNEPTHEIVEIDNSSNAALSYGSDALGSVPLGGDVWSAGSTVYDRIQGDTSTEQMVADLAGDAASFASDGISYMFDPISAAAGWVLDIILALVPPLQWILDQVTGSPSQMEDQMQLWEQIHNGLDTIQEDLQQDISSVSDWEGNEADTARSKIYELAGGIAAVAHECGGVQQILGIAKMISETCQEFIKSLIDGFVFRQVIKLGIALAAAIPTKGTSLIKGKIAAKIDLVKTKLEAVQTTMETTEKLSKSAKVLKHLGEFVLQNGFETIFRVMPSLGYSSEGGATAADFREGSVAVINTLVMEEESDFLRSLGQSAEEVFASAQSASTDQMTWGILFAFFSDRYNEEAANVTEQIGMARDALTGRADLLSNCATEWNSVEADLVSVFDELDEAALAGEGLEGSTTSRNPDIAS